MTDKETVTAIPPLRLAEIKLLSLSYRAKRKASLPFDAEAARRLRGSLTYSFHSRREKSFKLTVIHEIEAEDVSFRTRHEARIKSSAPIPEELFENKAFQATTVNLILPFGSELFANLSGRSFGVPIISPGRLPPREKTTN